MAKTNCLDGGMKEGRRKNYMMMSTGNGWKSANRRTNKKSKKKRSVFYEPIANQYYYDAVKWRLIEMVCSRPRKKFTQLQQDRKIFEYIQK